MDAQLPPQIARCEPTANKCPQVLRCARAMAECDESDLVDASICLKADWCPMFIDVRGVALVRPS